MPKPANKLSIWQPAQLAVLCGCEIKVWSPLVTARPSNLTRLYYNGSAAKSHSTTTQYRQLGGLSIWGRREKSCESGTRKEMREREARKEIFRPLRLAQLARLESLLGRARCRWSVTWYRDALGGVLLSIMAVLYHVTDHRQRAYFSRHYSRGILTIRISAIGF